MSRGIENIENSQGQHNPSVQPIDPPLSRPPTQALSTADSAGTGIQIKTPWKQDELGYFYPDLKDKVCVGHDMLVTQGSQTCYRDVNIFLEAVSTIAQFRGERLVRSQLHNYLRGAALQGCHSNLSSTERDLLRNL